MNTWETCSVGARTVVLLGATVVLFVVQPAAISGLESLPQTKNVDSSLVGARSIEVSSLVEAHLSITTISHTLETTGPWQSGKGSCNSGRRKNG
jgi:hypothetical protein